VFGEEGPVLQGDSSQCAQSALTGCSQNRPQFESPGLIVPNLSNYETLRAALSARRTF